MAKSLNTPRHLALMDELVKARRKAGLTQTELAEKLGRPQSYIAKIEVGERRLDVVEFIELMEAASVDPAAVLKRLRTAN